MYTKTYILRSVIIILLCINFSLKAQTDLITNGSFENANTFTGGWSAGGHATLAQNAFVAYPAGPNYTEPININILNLTTTNIHVDPSFIEFGPQIPKDGNKFAVLYWFETSDIQPAKPRIDFQLNSNLTNGVKYILKFSILKAKNTDRRAQLKIVIDDTHNNNLQLDHNKIFHKKISNDGSPNHDASSWDNYEVIFRAKSSDLDVIKFEFFGAMPPGKLMATYIDDVHLYEYCDYIGYNSAHAATAFCARTSGGMYPLAGPSASNGILYHDEVSSFHINNLWNVHSIDIEVFATQSGQIVKTWSESCKNGMSVVTWNGKTNGGSECSAGAYTCRVYCYNYSFGLECNNNTMTRSWTFIKLNGPGLNTPNHAMSVCSDLVPLELNPCCPYLEDIYIINQDFFTFPGLALNSHKLYSYQAANNIYFGPGNTIQPDVTVYLKAGNNIVFNGMHTGGGQLITEFGPCPPNRSSNLEVNGPTLMNNEPANEYTNSLSSEESISESKSNSDSILIYPNPNNRDYFNLYIASGQNERVSVKIIDMYGILLNEIMVTSDDVNKIDFNAENGIYFLLIQTGNKIYRKTLIKVS
jgi:Secretion system C-terminal sorting domain